MNSACSNSRVGVQIRPGSDLGEVRDLGVRELDEVEGAQLDTETSAPARDDHGLAIQARRVDEQPVRRGLPERADVAHDVAGAPLGDGRVGHGRALGAGGLSDQLHGQVGQRGHAADDELAGGLQAHHERLEGLGGVDAQLLDGLLAERAGGRVVLVLVDGKSNAGKIDARAAYARLRGIRDEASTRLGIEESDLALSMGMSRDLEWAIAESATIVRLGTAVFGARRL